MAACSVRKSRLLMSFGLVVGLLAGLFMASGGRDVAEALGLQLPLYGEVVAPVGLGDLTVNLYALSLYEPDPCVDGVLPSFGDLDSFYLERSLVLPPGGGEFDERLWDYGPWVVEVVDDSGGSVFQYFPPVAPYSVVSDDASLVGCFDFSGWMSINLGTLVLEAPLVVRL